MHYHSKWKPHQDPVHWVNLARVQEKGLQLWQTRSYAMIVHDSVLADCIEKVECQRGDKITCEILSTPRTVPKIVLKSAWKLQQQQEQRAGHTERLRETASGANPRYSNR